MAIHSDVIAVFGKHSIPLPHAFHGGVVVQIENGTVSRSGVTLSAGVRLLSGQKLSFAPDEMATPVYLTLTTGQAGAAPFVADVALGGIAGNATKDLEIPLLTPLLLGTLVQLRGTQPDDRLRVVFYSDPLLTSPHYTGEALAENNWTDPRQLWRYRNKNGQNTMYVRITNLGSTTSDGITLHVEGEALA